MMKRLVAFMLLLLMVSVPLTSFAQPEKTLVLGDMVDSSKSLSFTTTTLDGKTISSSIIKEYDLVVLNCWGEWCGPCVWELPYLQQVYENYKNVLILGLWRGNSKQEALDVARKAGVTYPLILPSSGDLNTYLRASNSFPHTFFFDCVGNQVGDMDVGAMDYDNWAITIEERLAMAAVDGPIIITQPEDVTVRIGGEATFTVEAKGEGLTYQWYGKAPNAAWGPIDGGTGATLTVKGTVEHNGWQYYCLVKNKDGEAKSNVVTLTVKQPKNPTIAQQPKDAKTKSGAKAKFTVKTKEKDVSFQWFVKAPGANEWEALKGGAKNTLIVIASKANNGAQYRCLVKNKEGGEVYTNAVKLTVTLQPPVIKTQPKNQNVKSGAKAKLSVKASGKNIAYQWYERANGDSEWKAVSGGNKNTLNVVASKANDGHQYYCYLKNADGEAKSVTVTLTVKTEAPTIKTQPKDVKVKLGAKAKFKVKASGKNVTYQWYYRENENAAWKALPGATKASYEIKKVAAENIGWQFKCLAKNADGEVWSNIATLLQKK